jgi:NDP-sugar pyrophosphorylase family protein
MRCAVVLAVGSPTHQSQLTYSRPPTMLPVLGKPITVRIMDRLYRNGFDQFIIIVGENEGAITAYLGSQWLPNVSVEFVLKPNSMSLSRALTEVARRQQQPFLITSYNTFTHHAFPDTLLKQHQQYPDDLLLTGSRTTLSKASPHNFAFVDKRQVISISHEITDKPLFILADIAVCGQKFNNYLVTQTLESSANQLTSLFQRYLENGGAAFLEETGWILPVETDRDLLTLNRHLLDEGQDSHILSELSSTVQIIPPVRIDPRVSIGQGSRIGPYVYLENGCSIGYETVIRNSIVLQNAIVPAHAVISESIVSSRAQLKLE